MSPVPLPFFAFGFSTANELSQHPNTVSDRNPTLGCTLTHLFSPPVKNSAWSCSSSSSSSSPCGTLPTLGPPPPREGAGADAALRSRRVATRGPAFERNGFDGVALLDDDLLWLSLYCYKVRKGWTYALEGPLTPAGALAPLSVRPEPHEPEAAAGAGACKVGWGAAAGAGSSSSSSSSCMSSSSSVAAGPPAAVAPPPDSKKASIAVCTLPGQLWVVSEVQGRTSRFPPLDSRKKVACSTDAPVMPVKLAMSCSAVTWVNMCTCRPRERAVPDMVRAGKRKEARRSTK